MAINRLAYLGAGSPVNHFTLPHNGKANWKNLGSWMNMKNVLLAGSLLGLFSLNSTANAEKAPLSAEALQSEAQAIVVVTVEKIRIESEPSTFERGLGNSDWGIYLTLHVETVEKGDVEFDTF